MLSRVGDRTHGAAVGGFACLLYFKVGRGFFAMLQGSSGEGLGRISQRKAPPWVGLQGRIM